jgi:hypothetical protein
MAHLPTPPSARRLRKEIRDHEERNGKCLGGGQATRWKFLISIKEMRRYFSDSYVGVCARGSMSFVQEPGKKG